MKISLTPRNKTLTVFSYSSLTDIVLLLLVFFLLTSSFIVTEGIKVILPEAEYSQTSEEKQVVINLLEDGRIYINGEETPYEEIETRLQAVITEPEEQVVVLASDKTVALEQAVYVIDQAKGVGASRFFISTTQKEETE
ncbi:MAG: biopolymer transporter ExbD [Ectothiorhodospiraceae bacterium]|nr:biopolymer transporter ExbD [Ectothiorhodospiraceae bacterium]